MTSLNIFPNIWSYPPPGGEETECASWSIGGIEKIYRRVGGSLAKRPSTPTKRVAGESTSDSEESLFVRRAASSEKRPFSALSRENSNLENQKSWRVKNTPNVERSWRDALPEAQARSNSFASVGNRKRRSLARVKSPSPPAQKIYGDRISYNAINTLGVGGETIEILDISDDYAYSDTGESPSVSLLRRCAGQCLSYSDIVRGKMLAPCANLPCSDKMADERRALFRWSGPLSFYCDEHVPYELMRGQIIPFYRDPDTGERVYYAGIDSKYSEVGGFGGAIDGRRNRSTRANEETIDGAFRELEEESMGIFNGHFRIDHLGHSPAFVVDDTLVILLRVNLPPAQMRARFEEMRREFYSGTKNDVFRENSDISVATSREMREAVTSGRIGGIALWAKYQKIISTVAGDYGFTF